MVLHVIFIAEYINNFPKSMDKLQLTVQIDKLGHYEVLEDLSFEVVLANLSSLFGDKFDPDLVLLPHPRQLMG